MAAILWIAWPLPAGMLDPPPIQSLTITDRHDVRLRDTRDAEGTRTAWVPLLRMDPDLPRAFVSVEDRRFFQHHGVDPRAVGRALVANLRAGHIVSGASTITMQLVRLLRPVGRGWLGKAVQTVWALRLEAHLDKARILEEYLNRVPLGQGTVGVSAAAELYFGGSAEQLSLGQAALLAALARAPASQNPLVDPPRAARRRTVGLQALQRDGYASAAEVARARREPLLGRDRGTPFLAPHFTSRLLFRAERDGRPRAGVWRTSLDLSLQTELEAEVRHTVARLKGQGARQAALVVLDNPTGEILAWVGSPDFWADTAGQVDMVVSRRQPGSALKPFLYALGFDRGFTAASVLADVARTYQTAGGPYHPRNYDRRYHGPVRVREALASSFNVPAVELTDRLGYATLLHGLHEAGFASLDRPAEFYGLGLALGNGDVTLLELANGYRALARGGLWSPVRWLPGPATPDPPERRVVSIRAAALVLDILADPVARIPGFGVRSPFDWPFRAAAKTGTSRHFTDNWAVATTGRFTVAVWVGNFSGRPMQGVSGVSGAGPLLRRAVLVTARHVPPGDLLRPGDVGLVARTICRVSGELPGPDCPTMTEYFIPGTEPHAVCDWHTAAGVRLPQEYAEWEAEEEAGRRTGGGAESRTGGLADRGTGDSCSGPDEQRGRVTTAVPSGAVDHPARLSACPPARLTITSPRNGDRYGIPPGVDPRYATVALRASGAPAGRLRWFVDGRPFTGDRWRLVPGSHEIRATRGGEEARVHITVE